MSPFSSNLCICGDTAHTNRDSAPPPAPNCQGSLRREHRGVVPNCETTSHYWPRLTKGPVTLARFDPTVGILLTQPTSPTPVILDFKADVRESFFVPFHNFSPAIISLVSCLSLHKGAMRFLLLLLCLGWEASIGVKAWPQITSPSAGDVFQGGEPLNVTWEENNQIPLLADLSSYQIGLYTGNNSNPVRLSNLD
jgi:hypothetical protein